MFVIKKALPVCVTIPNRKFFPVREVTLSLFKPERKGTSRTGSWILINRIWKLNMDFGILNLILMDSKLDFNGFYCVFLIFTVLNSRFNENNTKTSQMGSQKREGALLTVIQTKRQKLPERARTV